MRLTALALLFVLLAAACGDDEGTSTSAPEPWGRTFLTDGPPPVRVAFGDGTVTARSECNTMSGEASIDGGVLRVGVMATTEMGCDPQLHETDQWLGELLTGSPEVVLDGDVLTLTSGDDRLVLTDREVADPDRPLAGTRWLVDGLVTGDAVSSLPAGAEVPYLEFGDTGVRGNAGCNDFSGDAAFDDDAITVGQLIITDKACGDDAMAVEAAVLAALQGDVAYEIEAASLRLTGPGGNGLLLRAAE